MSVEAVTPTRSPPVDGAPRALEPARRRPAQHELRRREHLGQGDRDRPGDGHAGRAAVGQGLRRRPRHADRGRPRRPAARPAARARRRLPGRRPRGRDGRGLRLLPARPWRRGAVDRHRDARPRRCRPRRPPPPRLGHRPGDRGRRRGPDPPLLRRSRRLGRLAAPGFQLGLDMAAIRRRPPRGDRGDPRRPRDHGLGRDLRGVRGALARDHPDRRAVHRRTTAGPSRSGRRSPGFEPLPSRSATPARPPCCRSSAASPRPTARRSATTPTARSSSTSSARAEHPRLAALGTSCPDHFLRTKVRPMVLDLPPTADAAPRCSPVSASSTRPIARTTAPTTSATRRRTARRCAAPTRRSSSCRASACSRFGAEQADGAGRRRVLRQRHQRDARRRGAVDLRPDRRIGEVPHRVLGARGSQARADAGAEAAGRPGRVRDRRRVRASARRSPSGWPPRARASSSRTSMRPARRPSPASSAGPDTAISRRRRRHR